MKLPRHDEFSIARRLFELLCITAAAVLLVWQFIRTALSIDLPWWWISIVGLIGVVAADFVSGIIHWVADTWGRETMPVLGRRFLYPFRVHHINPDDFLRRSFLDTNGDVAMIVGAVLLAAFGVPLNTDLRQTFMVFLLGFCAAGLPTNQVHQWAHMPQPPRCARWLQDLGLILSRQAHRQHHKLPYAMNYCIATGWCNGVLTKLDFFRRIEAMISMCTGLVPRQDDTHFRLQRVEPIEREASV